LKAYGAALQYDPTQVVFEAARSGPSPLLASRGGNAPLFGVLYRRPGQLVLGNGLISGEPVSGRGLLAELDFRLLGGSDEAVFDLSEGYVASSGTRVRRVAQLDAARLVPRQFALFANFPNPFNPSTSIEYALPEATEVELAIYDVLGQKVQTLVAQQLQDAGYYRLTWDGRDSAGRGIASGMYFYRLATPKFVQTRKMTLIK
ncbi:T9SS type A sorting domain-containing protein, partial [bacterium]|nr:T9SS type A sorting domain-containing protein [bacterium]